MFKYCTKKNFAFTLSEVLITLGIIGIVAALTIPNLVYNYRKTSATAKLKKTYATLQNAIQLSMASNLGYSYVNFSDGDTDSMINWYNYYLKPNLKVQKDCIDTPGCWHTSGVTKQLNGQTALWDEGTKGIGGNIIVFVTIDGVMVNLDGAAANDIETHFGVKIDGTSGLVVHADVNGDSPPNVIGQDIFVFVFDNKVFVPAGTNKTYDEVAADCSANGTGYFCFSYVLRNNWKLNDDMFF